PVRTSSAPPSGARAPGWSGRNSASWCSASVSMTTRSAACRAISGVSARTAPRYWPRKPIRSSWRIASSPSSVSASRGASWWVMTRTTPSSAEAAEASMLLTRPRAIVAHSGWRCNGSSRGCSEAYGALPRTLAGPSTRVRSVPMAVARSSSLMGDSFVGGRSRGPFGRQPGELGEHRHQGSLGHRHLELVAGDRPRLLELSGRGLPEHLVGGRGAEQRLLGAVGAPGAVGHAAQGEAGGPDGRAGAAGVELEHGGDRDQREGVGGTVADLAVGRALRGHRGGQLHGRDQVPVL